MTKIIMILAITTAFIAGSALTSVMSAFQADAKENKVTLDSLATTLSHIEGNVTSIKATTEGSGTVVDNTLVLVQQIKTTTETTSENIGIISTDVAFIKDGIGTSP